MSVESAVPAGSADEGVLFVAKRQKHRQTNGELATTGRPALAWRLLTMLLATTPTNNAILAQQKLHRTPCSRTHLGDAPLARLWPFLAHPTDRDRCNIDGTKLRRPWDIRRARFGGRIAQLRGASWPTNNGRRSLIDSCGTHNTAPLRRWPQAKLLRQCSCSPGDRGDRWRRNAKLAFISQTT